MLNGHVPSVYIIDHGDYMSEDAAYEPSDYWKVAYRQYSLGYLGRGNHKTIPSCVVWRVCDQYPFKTSYMPTVSRGEIVYAPK